MGRFRLEVAIGATASSIAWGYSAGGPFTGTKKCKEYFNAGGFCTLEKLQQEPGSKACKTAGCDRDDCCKDEFAAAGSTNTDRCNTWLSTYSCVAGKQVARKDLSSVSCTSGTGSNQCNNNNCCELIDGVKTCKNYFDSKGDCPSGETREGNLKICVNNPCKQTECCYKNPPLCSAGFFTTNKCDSRFYTTRNSQRCAVATCTTLDCCQEKVGVGHCNVWWGTGGNQCGDSNKLMEYRKADTTLCPKAQCTESDCCELAPTCAEYTGCKVPQVLTHLTTTPCKAGGCDAATCCVTKAKCASMDCIAPRVAKTLAADFVCPANPCTMDDCCTTPATPAPATPAPVTPAPTKPKATLTCDTFPSSQCTGTDKKNRKYTVSVGKLTPCVGACDKATCCAVEAEATCFPGEGEISTGDGSRLRLVELQPSMPVLAGNHVEPVIGLLHLHSESVTDVVHVTPASV